MNRQEKQLFIEGLNKTFTTSTSVFLVSFSGVSVPEDTELRRRIRESGSQYQVIKNRLALRAITDTSLEQLEEHFQGPTAIASTGSDPVTLAKLLRDFGKNNPGFIFKGGVLGDSVLSASELSDLAEMPSREELISKLLYLLTAPYQQLAGALKAPLRNLAVLFQQMADKRSSEES